MDFVNIDNFFSEYIDRVDIQAEQLDEARIRNFVATAVQKIIVTKSCEHFVDILQVKNYNAKKPANMYKIEEMAYCMEDLIANKVGYVDQIVSYTNSSFEECDIKLSIDCPDCADSKNGPVKIQVDDNWLKANSERHYWNVPFYNGAYGLNKIGPQSKYHSKFALIRPAQHKFFGASYHVKDSPNLDMKLMADSPVEYKVEANSIRLNMERGNILISYLRTPTDEKGYPLIPNDPDVFEAIFWDVESKMLYRDKYKKEGAFNMSMNAKQLAEQYFARAKEKLDTVTPHEWSVIRSKYFRNIPVHNLSAQGGRKIRDKYDSMIRRNGR